MSEQTQNHRLCDLFTAACHSNMMDFPRLTNLCYHLMQTEHIPGAVTEFGCHKGHTAALLAAMTKRTVWCYDSFKGLPAKSSHDITAPRFVEGALKCSRWECEQTFNKAGLRNESYPVIVEAWFDNIPESKLPQHISYAHLDADFHDSTMAALHIVYPRLTPGAVCVCDDYSWTGLPGVKVAVDEFLKGKPELLVHPMTLGYPGHHAWFAKLP